MISVTESTERSRTRIFFTDDARKVYVDMARHVMALSEAYGAEHPWTAAAALSYSLVAQRMLTFTGTVELNSDGPLSLIGFQSRVSGQFVFGVNWSPVKRGCKVEGCRWYANDKGQPWHYGLAADMPVPLHRHQWDYPIGAPAPGTWSVNS